MRYKKSRGLPHEERKKILNREYGEYLHRRLRMNEEERHYYEVAYKLEKILIKKKFLEKLRNEVATIDDIENLISIAENEDIDFNSSQKEWVGDYKKQLKKRLKQGTSLGDDFTAIFKAAVKAGFMEETDTGYRWVYLQEDRGTGVALGYFLRKLYKDNRVDSTKMANLFGLESRKITKYVESAKVPKCNITWNEKIDEFFHYQRLSRK